MGSKHCGKRRNCSLRAISAFPTVFSKHLLCRHVKTRATLAKVYYQSMTSTKQIIIWNWTQKIPVLNPFPNKPWFSRVCSTSLLKTLWEKEKLLITSNLSFSHSVFYLFEGLSVVFIEFEIVICKLFQFGRV